MEGPITRAVQRLAGKRRGGSGPAPPPRALQETDGEEVESYRIPPFVFTIKRAAGRRQLPGNPRHVAPGAGDAAGRPSPTCAQGSAGCPEAPLTFNAGWSRSLSQAGAGRLASIGDTERVRVLSRGWRPSKRWDTHHLLPLPGRPVSEFYVDAPGAPVYLDHARYGRCETRLILTERERKAIETHMDTFKGYTIDFSNPSLKNEFDIFGTGSASPSTSPPGRQRILPGRQEADLERSDPGGPGETDVLPSSPPSFLLAALELGMNVTIVGETGTGKTTLLNALDEALNPRLRRIYVEDAVETKDLLGRGYHQMKLKVDPFERWAERAPGRSRSR